jgi:hypothetical protein
MQAQSPGREPGLEQPVLWLGMAGFPPTQRNALERSIARATGLARWRLCSFGDADGWWINGAKCTIAEDDRLKVAPGLPTEHTLRLELKEVSRPLAFAQPLAPENLEALCVFDATSDESVHGALVQFEKWLLPVRTRFVLGALLLQRESDDRRGTFHLRGQRRCRRAPIRPISGARRGNAAHPERGSRPTGSPVAPSRSSPGVMCAAPSATCCRRVTARRRFTTAMCRGCRCAGCETRN